MRVIFLENTKGEWEAPEKGFEYEGCEEQSPCSWPPSIGGDIEAWLGKAVLGTISISRERLVGCVGASLPAIGKYVGAYVEIGRMLYLEG